MARKLKTYITSLGFSDEAVAAPSMKGVLDAWGFGHNVLQKRLKKETYDPANMKTSTATIAGRKRQTV